VGSQDVLKTHLSARQRFSVIRNEDEPGWSVPIGRSITGRRWTCWKRTTVRIAWLRCSDASNTESLANPVCPTIHR